VIARHTLVRDLIENEWLFFFRIGEDQSVYQRKTNRTWEKMCPDGK